MVEEHAEEPIQGGSPRLRKPLSRSVGSLNSLAAAADMYGDWADDDDYEEFEDIVQVCAGEGGREAHVGRGC